MAQIRTKFVHLNLSLTTETQLERPPKSPVTLIPVALSLPPLIAIMSEMSGAAEGSNSTAKLQEDKKPEIDPVKTSQQPSQPNILEEDDEFEDFPIEGELFQFYRASVLFPTSMDVLTYLLPSRLDARRGRSTWRQCTPLGRELG